MDIFRHVRVFLGARGYFCVLVGSFQHVRVLKACAGSFQPVRVLRPCAGSFRHAGTFGCMWLLLDARVLLSMRGYFLARTGIFGCIQVLLVAHW